MSLESYPVNNKGAENAATLSYLFMLEVVYLG